MHMHAHVQTAGLCCRRSPFGGSLVFGRSGDNLRTALARLCGKDKEHTTTLHRYIVCLSVAVCWTSFLNVAAMVVPCPLCVPFMWCAPCVVTPCPLCVSPGPLWCGHTVCAPYVVCPVYGHPMPPVCAPWPPVVWPRCVCPACGVPHVRPPPCEPWPMPCSVPLPLSSLN